jgi:hypothetical protein
MVKNQVLKVLALKQLLPQPHQTHPHLQRPNKGSLSCLFF